MPYKCEADVLQQSRVAKTENPSVAFDDSSVYKETSAAVKPIVGKSLFKNANLSGGLLYTKRPPTLRSEVPFLFCALQRFDHIYLSILTGNEEADYE